MSDLVWQLDGRLLDALTELGAPFERVEAGAYLVELAGRARVWLIAGEQAVAVEAFVLHLIEVADPALLHLAYGDRLALDEALRTKVLADGAGRRPAGTPDGAPRRDARR